jgi:hypothetical protein
MMADEKDAGGSAGNIPTMSTSQKEDIQTAPGERLFEEWR